MLYWYKTQIGHFHVGFSISKKVGNAVQRNQLKRRLRACFQELSPALRDQSVDFVVIARKGSADTSYAEICRDVQKLLKKAQFMV